MSKHPFPEGTRVRHYGEQWPEAVEKGTGNVLRAVLQPDNTYEYFILRDQPVNAGGSLTSWWSSYRTIPIGGNTNAS